MVSLVKTADDGISPTTQAQRSWIRRLAWIAAFAAFGNLVLFVIYSADPVIQSDDWYFLDVFLSKALNGTLTISDFFVKRYGFDHAQPLVKIINFFELRLFDLNFAVGAYIGTIAAAVSAMLLYRLTVSRKEGRFAQHCLAWVAMCAVLFSLNAHAEIWTAPLETLGNLANLIILIFFLAVWHAQSSGKYLALATTTLFLAISLDDSAIIAALAAIAALLIVVATDKTCRRGTTWRVMAVIVVIVVLVRIGYAYAPVVGGTIVPSNDRITLLIEHFEAGGWWQWIVFPLSFPIAYYPVATNISASTWNTVQIAVGFMILIAHVLFWWRTFSGRHNQATFVATALMVLSYGWLAGIIISRIPVYGNNFIREPRYVLLFSTQLLALLLYWATSWREEGGPRTLGPRILKWLPVTGCLLLILVQIPNSIQSWQLTPYLWIYYQKTALQINELVIDPTNPPKDCQAWIHVCNWPLAKRVELPRLLSNNHLNVYSPRIQQMYPYLPHLSPPAHVLTESNPKSN